MTKKRKSASNSRAGQHANPPSPQPQARYANGSAASHSRPLPSVLPRYKHALAVHAREQESILTRSGGVDPNSRGPNFNGFRNLMLLVILVSNLRLMIENFRKYGVLICIRCHDYRRQDVVYGTVLYFSVPCSLFIAYSIELAAAQWAKSWVGQTKKLDKTATRKDSSFWYLIAFCHAFNASLNLGVATYVVYYFIHHPGIGTLCQLHAIIVWLKTCSYALTNRDLRQAFLADKTPDEFDLPKLYSGRPYPRNITLNDLSYFWWAPTLVYQPVYPRTTHIRWSFVLKRVLEIIGLCIAIWLASAQYAVPLLQNSITAISDLDATSFLERLMKLSSISLFCWLAGFFACFQSGLNLLAELTRFADRRFYDEWWNSPDIRSYWTRWNKPVYQFMKRHVFLPLVARGCPPVVAQVLVFLLSAVLHEVAIGVPTHNIIGVGFAGMMFQLPLIFLTDQVRQLKWLSGPTIGNMIFWVSFVLVGQPLAALISFFSWHAKYGSVRVPEIPIFTAN